MTTGEESRDLAIFQILANELPETEPKATDRKIKSKLRRSKLGDFDQAHVEALRHLHDDLQTELAKYERSPYYRPTPANVAAIADWDTARMANDFHQRYPSVSESDLRGIVGYAVYFYYLR